METPLGTLKEVYAKTKTLIVKDLEGLLVVPPELEPLNYIADNQHIIN
tara:strand:- start:68 stop:211 length:144 start_codon:yes stop_codon:yes gene_type:complete